MADHRRALAAIATLWLALPAGAESEHEAPSALVVIVSEAWTGPDSLDRVTLRRLYLGQRTELGGKRIHPLHLPLGSPEREFFSRSLLGRTAAELEGYWIEQALQGGALPPREVEDVEALFRALRADPRAIGYARRSDASTGGSDGIRVIEPVIR